MSKSSQRRKQQAKRAALQKVKQELRESAPSAIPSALLTQITQEITTEYHGPIPPPALMAQYDTVIPNGAERLMAMAEKQLDHRIDLEKTVIHGDSRRSWWGLILGFVAALVIAGVGLAVAILASPFAGATIITGTVVSLAGVFVYGQRSRRAEREHKAELMAGKRR
jgi:uncharacterized membrane protein